MGTATTTKPVTPFHGGKSGPLNRNQEGHSEAASPQNAGGVDTPKSRAAAAAMASFKRSTSQNSVPRSSQSLPQQNSHQSSLPATPRQPSSRPREKPTVSRYPSYRSSSKLQQDNTDRGYESSDESARSGALRAAVRASSVQSGNATPRSNLSRQSSSRHVSDSPQQASLSATGAAKSSFLKVRERQAANAKVENMLRAEKEDHARQVNELMLTIDQAHSDDMTVPALGSDPSTLSVDRSSFEQENDGLSIAAAKHSTISGPSTNKESEASSGDLEPPSTARVPRSVSAVSVSSHLEKPPRRLSKLEAENKAQADSAKLGSSPPHSSSQEPKLFAPQPLAQVSAARFSMESSPKLQSKWQRPASLNIPEDTRRTASRVQSQSESDNETFYETPAIGSKSMSDLTTLQNPGQADTFYQHQSLVASTGVLPGSPETHDMTLKPSTVTRAAITRNDTPIGLAARAAAEKANSSRGPSPFPQMTTRRKKQQKHSGLLTSLRGGTEKGDEKDKAKFSRSEKSGKEYRAGHNHAHLRSKATITEADKKRYEGLWAANRGILLDDYNRLEVKPSQLTEAMSSEENDAESLAEEGSEYESEREMPYGPPMVVAPTGYDSTQMVSNIVVRDLWRRSNLPFEQLSRIWKLVDRKKRGMLDRDEFIVGTWYVDQALRGRKLPAEIGPDIWGSVRKLGVQLRGIDTNTKRKKHKRRLRAW